MGAKSAKPSIAKKPPPRLTGKTDKARTGAIKIICDNRRARFDYHLLERSEAGLVLMGSEVKSLRAGKAHLTDAYVSIRAGEAWLMQAHIEPYSHGGYVNHESKRPRKLLLKQAEIGRLGSKTDAKGFALIPTKVYFKGGLAKIEIALATGKKAADKRDTIRARETRREMDRAMKRGR